MHRVTPMRRPNIIAWGLLLSACADGSEAPQDRAVPISGPAFAMQTDTIPQELVEIVVTAEQPRPDWASFRRWLYETWLNHNQFAPTTTEFYAEFPTGGGTTGTTSPNGTPAPPVNKPLEVPIPTDSIGTLCPDLPTRNLICLDAWISQSGKFVFAGDNREITPNADYSMSRVQVIIDLSDPGASFAVVSPTCLVTFNMCREPLGQGDNQLSVQYSNGVYSVNYSFRNSMLPSVFGLTPSIAGSLQISLDHQGWAQLVGGWGHSSFPSVAMWHMRYGRHNRKLIASDTDTNFKNFILQRFETTYTTPPSQH
jgi:hypothetical protein